MPDRRAPGGFAGNRIVRLLIFSIALSLLGFIGPQLCAQLAIRAAPAARSAILGAGTAIVILTLLFTYRGLVHLLERRPPAELGVAAMPRALAGGIGLGAGLFALVMLLLWAMGVARVSLATPVRLPVFALIAGALAAFAEELIVRGVVFRILEESLGTACALVLSAGFFGGLHAANPGASVFSSIAVALEAGLLLALALVASRSLWLPIGVHFGWNVAQSALFGNPDSGYRFAGVFRTSTAGPELLTGGAFGPEASVVAIVVCMAAATVLGVVAIRRGEWKSRRFDFNAR